MSLRGGATPSVELDLDVGEMSFSRDMISCVADSAIGNDSGDASGRVKCWSSGPAKEGAAPTLI